MLSPPISSEAMRTSRTYAYALRSRQLSPIICKRRLSWLGHAVIRLPPVRFANQVLQWFPEGRRRASKMNWRQSVERDLQSVNKSWKEALSLAADRTSWTTLTASCVTRRGSS
ncbi:hypothetical protein Bbelb_092250 [Branchiostoma belcheri]|nr:hypothetical protein Bbelb_092250 [Branchiostoma belcheri]